MTIVPRETSSISPCRGPSGLLPARNGDNSGVRAVPLLGRPSPVRNRPWISRSRQKPRPNLRASRLSEFPWYFLFDLNGTISTRCRQLAIGGVSDAELHEPVLNKSLRFVSARSLFRADQTPLPVKRTKLVA